MKIRTKNCCLFHLILKTWAVARRSSRGPGFYGRSSRCTGWGWGGTGGELDELGTVEISDWIKYHRVVKINQVSDLRLEAAQGNKIDFTGFLQNVEMCYKKV